MTQAESPGAKSPAEDVLIAFLRQGATEPADFERLCGEHPELADELRRLYGGWRDIEGLLGSLLDEDVSVKELLARSVETTPAPLSLEIDPHLRGEDDTPADLVLRLRQRAEAFGRYEPRDEIGRGGMGIVHRVWDPDLGRFLAMKVLHPAGRGGEDQGNGSPADLRGKALSRFLEEVRVTGQLDHPGIVPVHELGIDAQGRVCFTMKLVKGDTLKRVLDKAQQGRDGWTVNRVVGVLLRVCEAVAYAHSKGVLHRDIKPANIMVGKFGEAYLMDWGLARVLDGAQAESLSGLEASAVPGPGAQRVAEEPADSWLFTEDGDVLGTPIYMSPEQARGQVELVDERSDIYSLGALLYHLIAGQMPYVSPGEVVLPFTVLMQVRRGAPTPLAELAPDAPPGLVGICEKAMARDVSARFASAAQMAAALEDYLEDISEAREEARRQEKRARLIADFLMEMLAWNDPARARGREVTVVEVLEQAAERVEDLSKQPLDEAALRSTIGNVYKQLGHSAAAEPHLARARELYLEHCGPLHADTLSASTDLALLHKDRGNISESELLLRETLEGQERSLGARDPATLRTLANLALVLGRVAGRLEEAQELFERAVAGRTAVLGEEHAETLRSMNGLALVLQHRGLLGEAEAILRRITDAFLRRDGESHPATLIAMTDLASLLQSRGQLEEAEPIYRRTLEVQRRILPDGHPNTLTSMNNLAMLLERRGAHGEAEALLRAALDGQRARLGDDHQTTLTFMNNLALFYDGQGRSGEAEPLLREAIRRADASMSPAHRVTARFRFNLGRCLLGQERVEEALAELRGARGVLLAELGPEHPWTRDAVELIERAAPGTG